MFASLGDDLPEVEVSAARLDEMLVEIKRNSRNRRIAMVAPLLLVAAVVGAMVAAPPQHGGLALVADADTPDPQLPRVFGSNGVWRLAEPIDDAPADPGPASVVEAPTDPISPDFSLAPPDEQARSSFPTSTSTPPTSTSGQTLSVTGIGGDLAADVAEEAPEVADDVDFSEFMADIRIEPVPEEAPTESSTDEPVADEGVGEAGETGEAGEAGETGDSASAEATEAAPEAADSEPTDSEPTDSEPTDSEIGAPEDGSQPTTDSSTTEDVLPENSTPENPTPANSADEASDEFTPTPDAAPVADDDSVEANPSRSPNESDDGGPLAFSAPATITPTSVLVYSAHVSVTVEVFDPDSPEIDWCNTRIDWGDGSITRVAGSDDADTCAAQCEQPSASSASSVSAEITFEHSYSRVIDASPRIFVASGDGCAYTLAELQLPPFTVVPLP